MSRDRRRRNGPVLSDRGFAIILYALTLAYVVAALAGCFRS